MADAEVTGEAAAITAPIDLSARAKLRFRGEDRVRFVNGQVSNDVRRADDQSAMPACVCSLKGKLDALVFITATGSDGGALLIDGPPELREDDTLLMRFDRYLIADAVELEDVGDDFALWHFLPGADRPDLPGAVWKKSNRFGVEGHDLWLTADSAAQLAGGGESGGQARTLLDPDDPRVEALRIRHRVPRWGAELGPDILPAEAGLDRNAVDFHKGCYTGQEVVSRIESVGRVNRSLCLLEVIETGPARPPAPGDELFPVSSNDSGGEKAVGRLTSVTPDAGLALGYVRRGHNEPNTRLVTAGQSASLGNSTVLEIREI